MPSIQEIQAQLEDDFVLLQDWEEKYTYLIELGMDMPDMDPKLKQPENLVQGCQSSVWFSVRCADGRLYFDSDSDSLIVKGLVAVLTKILNGQPAQDYAAFDLSFFEKLGFWRHLSSQRSNGLTSMIGHLKQAAQACAGTSSNTP